MKWKKLLLMFPKGELYKSGILPAIWETLIHLACVRDKVLVQIINAKSKEMRNESTRIQTCVGY